MTALAVHAPALRMNWPRIGALSGTLSLHFYLLLLLIMPPVAYQAIKKVPVDQVVTFILPEKKVELKEPELPQPIKKVVRTPLQPPPQPVPHDNPVVTDEPNIMAYPATGPGPDVPTHAQPTEVAPSAVAYGGSTKLIYPIDSIRRGEHGKVVLRVLVGADGLPQQIEIEHSSGYARLDAAARESVRHWTFHPGTINGAAQSAWALVPVSFDLTQL